MCIYIYIYIHTCREREREIEREIERERERDVMYTSPALLARPGEGGMTTTTAAKDRLAHRTSAEGNFVTLHNAKPIFTMQYNPVQSNSTRHRYTWKRMYGRRSRGMSIAGR